MKPSKEVVQMSIKRLVVKEVIVTEDSVPMEVGEIVSYFVDPETGKYYRPKEIFEVSGDDLSKNFIEVQS